MSEYKDEETKEGSTQTEDTSIETKNETNQPNSFSDKVESMASSMMAGANGEPVTAGSLINHNPRIKIGIAIIVIVLACFIGIGIKDNISKVELGTYKGMKLTEQTSDVTKSELEKEIESNLDEYATKTNRASKKGDTVVINYKGTIKGKSFDGNSATGYRLKLGSSTFITGFEDQLIGYKAGSKVKVTIKFPSNYSNKDLQGKTAIFNVTIKKVLKTPTLTDKFAKSKLDTETAAAYKKKVKKDLKETKEQTNKSSYQETIWNKLTTDSKIKHYDQDAIDSYKSKLVKYYKSYAKQQNMTYKKYIKNQFGMTTTKFEKQLEKAAKSYVKEKMIVEAIAKKENIELTDAEYKKQGKALAIDYGYTSLAQLEKSNSKNTIRLKLLEDKVTDYILKNAKFTKATTETSTTTTKKSTSKNK